MGNEHDFHPTPMPLVDVCVNKIAELAIGPAPRILDIGAADGRWGHFARDKWPTANIVGVEIRDVEHEAPYREDYDFWLHSNFLNLRAVPYDCPDEFDLILGNPPFKIAQRLVKRCMANLAPAGYLIFLLRLGFLCGQRRHKDFWPKYPLQHFDLCPKRPSFSEDGGNDMTEYALFRWQLNVDAVPTFGRLDYVDEKYRRKD